MAKDGTFRGGARPNSGPHAEPLEVFNFQKVTASDSERKEHKTPEYLSEEQLDESTFEAAEIYQEISARLKKLNVLDMVDPLTIEQYSVCVARWRQCERNISKLGMIGSHPTTNAPMLSIYVKGSELYSKQMMNVRYQMEATIKGCAMATPEDDDSMEGLLLKRGG